MTRRRRALITGISGQDGSYLADLLLAKGYEVHGVVKPGVARDPASRLVNLRRTLDRISLHAVNLENQLSLFKIVHGSPPDECYHLAASSFVSHSFDDEHSILSNNFNATHSLLAALKEWSPHCKLYFAGSSEMFGSAARAPQNEATPFAPRSIYGIAKLASYHLVRNYRDKYRLFACAGLLYNHESPRRGFEFVTRKITSSAARIKLGLQDSLELGNLDAVRDWGYAPDFVEAMWLMLQRDDCEDFVVSTGTTHSVREFLQYAFECVGLDYQPYVRFNQRYFRPAETIPLVGDSAKARATLNWRPSKNLREIVHEMVHSDLELLKRGAR